jgi:xanthine dehydrogenase YagR molybdenum-binding subunit
MGTGISRRGVLQGAAALGALGLGRSAHGAGTEAAGAANQTSTAMFKYIGTPTPRVDGRAKVTGAAKYAAEFNVPGLAHASIVPAAIAKGRIAGIDASEALAVDGVIDVLTHANRPNMADNDKAYMDDVAPGGSPFRPLYDEMIKFSRQPVALVVAEDADTARFAASLVRVAYSEEQSATDLHGRLDAAFALGEDSFALTPAQPRGDAQAAFAAAEVRHAAEYYTAIEHHNPMELFATTVAWDGGGKITVFDKTQGVQNVQRQVVGVFEMRPEDVRVLSPFVGGAFGAGLRPQYQVLLAVLAARHLERSVRLVLTRAEMYTLSYRPGTVERLALGASADGRLASTMHEAIAMTSQYEEFARKDTIWSGALYKSPNAKYAHKLTRLDLPTPGDMRAPGAASGVYALECAMDELAVALKMDPVELRLINYSDRDQNADIPYSSKALRECYRQGAEAFGWDKRSPEPRSMRDGRQLVGWGMATGVWEALQVPFGVRVALSADGKAEIASGTSDIGTGTYTIMTQVAADMLGLPLEDVTVTLGDSSLPPTPVEGGSWTAASTSAAIVKACDAVREELLGLAQKLPNSPLAGARPQQVALVGGRIVSTEDASRAVPIVDAMRSGQVGRIAHERTSDADDDGKYARNTHTAVFAEVTVDEELGVIRVTRVVDAVAAGRILNTKTAHSQIMGGVIWGIGMALHEATHVDHRFGRVMNANIAEYLVPVSADVQDVQVIFVDEPDAIINPLGIKGVGEIGIVGVAAAIANAVYHATGKRVRDLPITLDRLLV